MLAAQQFVGRIIRDHGNFQSRQILHCTWLRAAIACQDDDREVQVGAGEGQISLAFGGRHHGGEQVELAGLGLLQDLAPAVCCARLQAHAQALFEQRDVIGGQALVAALWVAELERRPGGIDAQAQYGVLGQPVALLFAERQGGNRTDPIHQTQQENGRQSRHGGLVTERVVLPSVDGA
ncbi:hypothetical protein FQZ97_799990 [compost metagenome]